MSLFMVTVKFPKNKDHNPHDKKTGPCPVNGKPCTDVTGEHHTAVLQGNTVEEITALAMGFTSHITYVIDYRVDREV